MIQIRRYLKGLGRLLPLLIVGGLALLWLLWHKLGSLTGGLSQSEMTVALTPIGWHGLYQHPMYLPLEVVRAIVFYLDPQHHQFLVRLPNTVFGGLAILSFARLIWLWHGSRTAMLATILFATSAWTLHVSRLASFDVIYLWAIPTLLLVQLELQQGIRRVSSWYLVLMTLGVMLYVPGLVWLVLLSVFLQRKPLLEGWQKFSKGRQRMLSLLCLLIWIPLLLRDLMRPGQLVEWLGLPAHFPSIMTLGKQFVDVFIHLFIRGPQDPELWLDRLPIFDMFTLIAVILGIYFYVSRRQSRRSKLLVSVFAIGVVLVSLGGPVGLSFLVPVLYMAAATGLAYLLHDWLRIFPLNPLARGIGIGIVVVAVMTSSVYNYRAYFVAWPHNALTKATFSYHL